MDISSVAFYCQSGHFINRIKFLIKSITGVLAMNFLMDWESETVNQTGLQTKEDEEDEGR